MDLDDQLNIYVLESNHHRIVKWLAPTYKEYVVVAGDGTSSSTMNQLDSQCIQLWSVGSTIGQTVLESDLFNARKIKRDCHGNLYVLDYRSVKFFSSSVAMTGSKQNGEILLGLSTNAISFCTTIEQRGLFQTCY